MIWLVPDAAVRKMRMTRWIRMFIIIHKQQEIGFDAFSS